MTIIGIDPGKSGGIAYLRGDQVVAGDMPQGVAELQDFLTQLKDEDPHILVFLEKVNLWRGDEKQKGKNFGIDKMIQQNTMLQTVLKVEKIPFVLVPAISWQSTMQLIRRGVQESQTEKKNRHKTLAQKYYPRIKVKHSTADALLIMTFGKIKMDSDIDWILSRMPKPVADKLL